MRKTRREAAESQQEAAVAMVETAAPPPADPADEIPSLATEAAEAARLEVVRLAGVEDRLRELIREADGTAVGYARGAGTSAAMAGDLSGEPDAETIRAALEVEVRRAYAEGALEAVHRWLFAAVHAWRAAIGEALGPAAVAIETAIYRHAASEGAMREACSREYGASMNTMPPGGQMTRGWIPNAEAEWQAERDRLALVRTHLRTIWPALATWKPEDPASLRTIVRAARLGPLE